MSLLSTKSVLMNPEGDFTKVYLGRETPSDALLPVNHVGSNCKLSSDKIWQVKYSRNSHGNHLKWKNLCKYSITEKKKLQNLLLWLIWGERRCCNNYSLEPCNWTSQSRSVCKLALPLSRILEVCVQESINKCSGRFDNVSIFEQSDVL